ncbi:hypothetical protein P7K49_011897 [Saguinus oedipus]|uniref:Uncharacterized protein n=1 Tax=Saguinus oedipus TaxID=9490 RepID=A0ABQ9VSL2_SAGOE|nr:hypothetical protein P7K49_011897 [Saguinus oedipus]
MVEGRAAEEQGPKRGGKAIPTQSLRGPGMTPKDEGPSGGGQVHLAQGGYQVQAQGQEPENPLHQHRARTSPDPRAEERAGRPVPSAATLFFSLPFNHLVSTLPPEMLTLPEPPHRSQHPLAGPSSMTA